MTELKAVLQCKVDKINMMKREYIQLTEEVNQLTIVVQQEKESSIKRECAQQMQSRKLQCLQDKYSCLLNQYKELYNLHGKMQTAIKTSLEEAPLGGRSCRTRRQDAACLTEQNGRSADGRCQEADDEIRKLRKEIEQLDCENDRLDRENKQVVADRQRIAAERDRLVCEGRELAKGRDQALRDVQRFSSQNRCNDKEMSKTKEENKCLARNNELMSMENSELKIELECVTERLNKSEEKLRAALDKYECLRLENERLTKERDGLVREMTEERDKFAILREEECRENLAMKHRCEEMRRQVERAQTRAERLESEISKAEKRNAETAMLEADTQLLITKTDQEWNEMYVKKCTEVMELSEELECLRKKLVDMQNGQLVERSDLANENKRMVSMLKKTIQDYKTQTSCLKAKLDQCLAFNQDLKCENDSLESSNKSMKQFVMMLNREKAQLIEKINRLQSEVSLDEESLC